jgi:hypothetical protein
VFVISRDLTLHTDDDGLPNSNLVVPLTLKYYCDEMGLGPNLAGCQAHGLYVIPGMRWSLAIAL